MATRAATMHSTRPRRCARASPTRRRCCARFGTAKSMRWSCRARGQSGFHAAQRRGAVPRARRGDARRRRRSVGPRRHPVFQRALRRTRRRAARVRGRQPHRAILESVREGRFRPLLRSGSGRRRSSLIGPGSRAFDVSLSLTTTSSKSGQQLNLIVTDLTELLEANSNRARAEHDSRTKDEFLTMLAHELRTPLGVIANAVGVLEATHAEGASAARAHELIGRQVRLVSQLIDDLLDVERVVSGRSGFSDGRSISRRRCPKPSPRLSITRVDRQSRSAPSRSRSMGTRLRLQQVLTNIVGNAVKYTPPGSRICVEGPRRGRRRRDQRRRPGVRYLAETAASCVRPVRPGRSDDSSCARRPRNRPIFGPPSRRATWRQRRSRSDGEGHGSTFVVRLRQVASSERQRTLRLRRNGARARSACS